MKNIILSAALLFLFFTTNAQITFEGSYPGTSLPIARLESAGDKYVVVGSVITLYNLDNTIYRQIPIPPQPNATTYDIYYLSDGLFNTDTSDIEFLLVGTVGQMLVNQYHYVRIYNETGNILFTKDSAQLNSSSGSDPAFASIFTTDHGAKLNLKADGLFGLPISNSLIYGLPGQLPCYVCGNSGFRLAGMGNVENNQPHFTVYPNPGNNFSHINYELPTGVQKGTIVMYDIQGRELKHYPVDRSNNTLTLPIGELAQGTYLYSLETAVSKPTTRQMIVIR